MICYDRALRSDPASVDSRSRVESEKVNLRFEASRGGGGGGGKRIFGEESTRGITEGQVKDDGVADVKISKGGDTGGWN